MSLGGTLILLLPMVVSLHMFRTLRFCFCLCLLLDLPAAEYVFAATTNGFFHNAANWEDPKPVGFDPLTHIRPTDSIRFKVAADKQIPYAIPSDLRLKWIHLDAGNAQPITLYDLTVDGISIERAGGSLQIRTLKPWTATATIPICLANGASLGMTAIDATPTIAMSGSGRLNIDRSATSALAFAGLFTGTGNLDLRGVIELNTPSSLLGTVTVGNGANLRLKGTTAQPDPFPAETSVVLSGTAGLILDGGATRFSSALTAPASSTVQGVESAGRPTLSLRTGIAATLTGAMELDVPYGKAATLSGTWDADGSMSVHGGTLTWGSSFQFGANSTRLINLYGGELAITTDIDVAVESLQAFNMATLSVVAGKQAKLTLGNLTAPGSGGLSLAAELCLTTQPGAALTLAGKIDPIVTSRGCITIPYGNQGHIMFDGDIQAASGTSLFNLGSGSLTLKGMPGSAFGRIEILTDAQLAVPTGPCSIEHLTFRDDPDAHDARCIGHLSVAGTLQLGGLDCLASGTPTVDIGSGGQVMLTLGNDTSFPGTFTGAGSLTKAGAGTLTLTNPSDLSGTLAVTAGGIVLSGSTADFHAIQDITIGTNASLALDGDGSNRLPDSVDIHLSQGGVLSLAVGTATQPVTERIGRILGQSSSRVRMSASATQDGTLTCSALCGPAAGDVPAWIFERNSTTLHAARLMIAGQAADIRPFPSIVCAGPAAYLVAEGIVPATFGAVVPGAPGSVTATPGDGYAVVSFSAPASDGGAPITSYIVTASTGQTATGPASPILVSGLSNGVAVTFTVTAINSAGTSLASAVSNSVTPVAGGSVDVPAAANSGSNDRCGVGAGSALAILGCLALIPLRSRRRHR